MWRTITRRASSSLALLKRPFPPPSLLLHRPHPHQSTAPHRHLSTAFDFVLSPSSSSTETDDPFEDSFLHPPPPHPNSTAASSSSYAELKRRQIRIETEEWERAAREYRELLADMCERRLAPNLPYVKSLFMGWFEPLRDGIAEEQLAFEEGRSRPSYAPHFAQLPPDMMAVIVMHKLMGMLMTGGSGGGHVPVIHASLEVGEAIEQEARIQRFLEKTKKKTGKNQQEDEGESVRKEQDNLRKKVTGLIKKQRLYQVRKIVKEHDDTKPWGQEIQAKIGSRLIEMLIDTAYIQPPASQSADNSFDVRPAFRHTQKNVMKKKTKKKRMASQK